VLNNDMDVMCSNAGTMTAVVG